MNTKKTVLTTAVAIVMGFATIGAYAAVLNNGDQLTINPGVAVYDSYGNFTAFTGGSYFALDNGNKRIGSAEKTPIAQGTTGIIIGQVTTAGASHYGDPIAGDTNAIDAPWSFFGNTGSAYTTVGITGSTTAGLNMSGWTITWNGIPAINMGSGAWQTATGAGHSGAPGTFTNGIGNFTWNGVYGAAYTLNYRATVPLFDPSGFGGCNFEWHFEGVVMSAVPVPAAAWLFGSGLIGLLGGARRKSST